jgi:Rod binding domain-containing protein
MASDPTGGVRSYLDFGGLAQLKGQAGQADDPAVLRRTAEQFEAQFIQTLMKTMREATVLRGELLDSQAEDTYQDMMDKEVAQLMSRRGALGIADLLERQLAGGGVTPTAPSTHQVLALRSAGWVRPADQDPK